MKINRIDTSKFKGKEMNVVFLGDCHLGDKNFDEEKLKKDIKWIKSQKNTVVILMGDMINTGLKDSVGAGSFDDTITPQEQLDQIYELLLPIKKQIIGIHIGNHERRIYERTSIDVIKNLAKQLNINYLESSAFNHIRFGNQTYVIYSTHGSSGSTTLGGKINACIKLSSFIDADIYAMGHVHDLSAYTRDGFRLSKQNKTLEEIKTYFVLTGHYLKYGGYAEEKLYSPGKVGFCMITLRADQHQVRIHI